MWTLRLPGIAHRHTALQTQAPPAANDDAELIQKLIDIPVLRAAGLIVALSAPFGCAAYMSAVDVDHVNGSAKRRVLI